MGEVEDVHGDGPGRLGIAMDHQASFLRSFTAEGLLTAPGTHKSGDAAYKNILSIYAKDLVHVFLSTFLGMTDHAHEHCYLLLE